MPPTPIGRPPSRQMLVRTSGAGGVVLGNAAPINSNYSDSNLLRPRHDFGGSSQSLGTFANGVDAAFGNQYEKWSMGLDPAGTLQLADSPDIDPADKVLSSFNSDCWVFLVFCKGWLVFRRQKYRYTFFFLNEPCGFFKHRNVSPLILLHCWWVFLST